MSVQTSSNNRKTGKKKKSNDNNITDDHIVHPDDYSQSPDASSMMSRVDEQQQKIIQMQYSSNNVAWPSAEHLQQDNHNTQFETNTVSNAALNENDDMGGIDVENEEETDQWLDIEEIEQRTMGKFSKKEADIVFGTSKAGSIKSVTQENKHRLNEIERRENYYASAFRGINPSAAPPSIVGGSSGDSSVASLSSVVRPGEDAPSTDISYLLDSNLMDPNQQFMHINLVSRHIPPLSEVPGIRLCGAWETSQEVALRTNYFRKLDNRPTHLCWPAHKFRLLASCVEHLDKTYVKRKKHAILATYHQNRAIAAQQFSQKTQQQQQRMAKPATTMVTKQNTGVKYVSQQILQRREKRRKQSSRTVMFKRMMTKGLATGRTSDILFPDPCRLNDQRYAAIIFIQDLVVCSADEDPEPLFMFMRAFTTLEACDAYVEHVAQNKYPDYDIDVVDMYEWLWPTEVKVKDIQEKYRHNELAQIMHRSKIEKNKVLSYEQWCARKNTTPVAVNIPVSRAESEDT